MKHAGAATLARIEPLLMRLRSIEGLVERRPGVFYLRGRAFLHFHEDPAGVFADVRLDGVEFRRLAVTPGEFEPFARRVVVAVEGLTARRDGAGRGSTGSAGAGSAAGGSSDPEAPRAQADDFRRGRPPRDGRKG